MPLKKHSTRLCICKQSLQHRTAGFERVHPSSLLTSYEEMTPEQRVALAKVMYFFFGLHFECFIGEDTKAALLHCFAVGVDSEWN